MFLLRLILVYWLVHQSIRLVRRLFALETGQAPPEGRGAAGRAQEQGYQSAQAQAYRAYQEAQARAHRRRAETDTGAGGWSQRETWERGAAAGGPRRSPPAPELSPHEVLGVATNASQAEIQAAYRHLVQQYHPDQVAHLGAEIVEVATRRTKSINAAYTALRRRP